MFNVCFDKSASRELERNLKRLVSLRMAGMSPDAELSRFLESCPVDIRGRLAEWNIIQPERAASGKRLAEHVDAWARHLEARQLAPKHCVETVARVKRLFDGCRFMFWSDIRAEKIECWLADRRRDDDMSNRTSNTYLASAKSFAAWMVKSGYASENPVKRLSKLNESIDRRRERRPLEDDEISRLLYVVWTSEKILWGMNGRERVIMYALAMTTGLRWGELKKLVRADFDLCMEQPTVTARASTTKNKRREVLPLTPDVAVMVRTYFTENPGLPQARALPMPKSDMGSKIIKYDLVAAGIPKVNEAGQSVDFHSLRHTFITGLARNGVHPKIAQDLARHSSIDLTMRNYTHTKLESRIEAVGKLPDMTPTAPHDMESAATGTDDLLVSTDDKIVVSSIGSNGIDFMDNITTYGDTKDVIFRGGYCGIENKESPDSQGVAGLSKDGIPTGNRIENISVLCQ